MPAKKPQKRLFVVEGCHSCPNCVTNSTKPFGYALDYRCKVGPLDKNNRFPLIAGYVEWESEKRKDGDFPEWCPLKIHGR